MTRQRLNRATGCKPTALRRSRLLMALSGAVLLSACGRGAAPPVADQKMQQSLDAGRSAYDLGYRTQALSAYRVAYQRALLSNDQAGLGSAGYNLAVVHLRDHQWQAALDSVSVTEKDLAIRGFGTPARLALVQAAALYQGKNYAQAAHIACHLPSSPLAFGLRAQYFCGVSHVALGHDAQAQQSLTVLDQARAQDPRLRADRAALRAQLRLAQGRYGESLNAAQEAVTLNRLTGNYSAMRQMLDIASVSAGKLGRSDLARALTRQSQQSLEAENAAQIPSDEPDDLSAGTALSHSE
ncbi:hypothetical protein N5W20_01510 [Candidatus Kirkpatrickella diaphorinae]|uniref:Uncharacterized protein n=1 Tax=Candidatus Kirkpatrickella diaphorinae TaxID=2984322 RepID=A0ABY6GLE6_9PROT|nr:hypothetical protein [Candidatus Kirkpatrickella diaphorinae]UYH51583.1 hypothetical protein N5W20_01510 [Candidatus Kirkpatrickella diaphorinae]